MAGTDLWANLHLFAYFGAGAASFLTQCSDLVPLCLALYLLCSQSTWEMPHEESFG